MGAKSVESFAFQLTASCTTHKEWLAVMNYGMGTLLVNQPLLVELIDREAVEETRRGSKEGHLILVRIFRELKLKVSLLDELELPHHQ